ncbi:hypothetical protein ACH5RR_024506 [Cinchona calisaya]|uniref:non-specific serine/threonine protein kinase n=1 Tax=Cinchona calisaya TaxID=153742 RepID=A0ABD2YY18_9GENT
MSSPPPSGTQAPASPFPPADDTGTPPTPVNGTSNATGASSPAELSSPPPSAGNGRAAVTPPSPPGPGNNKTTLLALGVGIGIGGALVLVFVGIFVIWHKRRKRRLGLDGFGHATPTGPKGDPFSRPQHQWQQNTPLPVGNVAGMLTKPTPPHGILPHSQQFSDGSTPPPPFSVASSLNSEKPLQQLSPDRHLGVIRTTFSYEELALATDNFSVNNLLGEGGFGYVYKGVLHNGKEVAIKQLKLGSGQGEREFQAEVETISRVHHRHLVPLVGYCISGDQRLLVYEFVPNKTLEFHLHGKGHLSINWASRMKIAMDSAKGLAYLHEECHPKIIHRDIKAANILLDDDFEAKVADFGLARIYSDTDTHVSTRVMGTFGYLAPEYALTGKLTEKSDVFSFGVMILELITGRRPIDKAQHYLDDNIVDWARPLLTQALEDGNFGTLVDSRLQKDYDSTEMARMVACAAVCVRHLARRRPRMSQIVQALEGSISLEELNEGIRPGQSTIYDTYGSSDFDTTQYKEDLKKFRKMALECEEPNVSECSGPTSDFGLQPSGSSSEGNRTTQETHSTSKDEDGEK